MFEYELHTEAILAVNDKIEELAKEVKKLQDEVKFLHSSMGIAPNAQTKLTYDTSRFVVDMNNVNEVADGVFAADIIYTQSEEEDIDYIPDEELMNEFLNDFDVIYDETLDVEVTSEEVEYIANDDVEGLAIGKVYFLLKEGNEHLKPTDFGTYKDISYVVFGEEE